MKEDLTTRMVRLPHVARNEAAYLIVLASPDDPQNPPGSVYILGGFTRIGRLRTNDVVLTGDSVSRDHCSLELRHDGYYLRDEESANGTVVSGKRVRDGQLHRQETIQLGDYRFVFWQGAMTDVTLRALLREFGIVDLVAR